MFSALTAGRTVDYRDCASVVRAGHLRTPHARGSIISLFALFRKTHCIAPSAGGGEVISPVCVMTPRATRAGAPTKPL